MNIVKDEKCGAEIFDDGKVCLRNDFDDWKVELIKSGCTSAFNLHQRVTQQQKNHA